mmetsp:Transcript_74242/g.131118  ORF Transcript_74242/g.131118 Transcript_74242/m.131118 type:complete len:306 (+) Transcript_74242:336-1253(+)
MNRQNILYRMSDDLYNHSHLEQGLVPSIHPLPCPVQICKPNQLKGRRRVPQDMMSLAASYGCYPARCSAKPLILHQPHRVPDILLFLTEPVPLELQMRGVVDLNAAMAKNPIGICFMVKAECAPRRLMIVAKCRAFTVASITSNNVDWGSYRDLVLVNWVSALVVVHMPREDYVNLILVHNFFHGLFHQHLFRLLVMMGVAVIPWGMHAQEYPWGHRSVHCLEVFLQEVILERSLCKRLIGIQHDNVCRTIVVRVEKLFPTRHLETLAVGQKGCHCGSYTCLSLQVRGKCLQLMISRQCHCGKGG